MAAERRIAVWHETLKCQSFYFRRLVPCNYQCIHTFSNLFKVFRGHEDAGAHPSYCWAHTGWFASRSQGLVVDILSCNAYKDYNLTCMYVNAFMKYSKNSEQLYS